MYLVWLFRRVPGIKRTLLFFLAPLTFHSPTPEDGAVFFSRFSQRIFLDIPHLLLCYPSTATAKTSYGEMDSLPQTWIFSCHCRSKALLGLALAANPKLCVWSEERMMKEPDFDKREWWLLFSAFLGWFFQFPPGSTELLPGLIRSYWADTGDLLATYTCCNLKLLKDFRAGME